MERVPKESEKLTCPYDSCHHIMRSSMTLHLLRCRRTRMTGELVTCPFDVTHIFPKPELDVHIDVCESRQGFEKYRTREIDIIPVTESLEEQEVISCEENWDNEPPVPAYNPQKESENKNIIRQPVGMTPSQRVAFRNAERARLRNMREDRNRSDN